MDMFRIPTPEQRAIISQLAAEEEEREEANRAKWKEYHARPEVKAANEAAMKKTIEAGEHPDIDKGTALPADE